MAGLARRRHDAYRPDRMDREERRRRLIRTNRTPATGAATPAPGSIDPRTGAAGACRHRDGISEDSRTTCSDGFNTLVEPLDILWGTVMSEIKTALVIGGGIAGPVAAMALRKAGIEATV